MARVVEWNLPKWGKKGGDQLLLNSPCPGWWACGVEYGSECGEKL